jgi:hypothetical protein
MGVGEVSTCLLKRKRRKVDKRGTPKKYLKTFSIIQVVTKTVVYQTVVIRTAAIFNS